MNSNNHVKQPYSLVNSMPDINSDLINEFLDVGRRSSFLIRQSRPEKYNTPQSMPIYNRRQPAISRPNPGNLVDRNRSVRDILKDRREKEKLHQQQIEQAQNTIKEEQQDSKKEHKFILDEKRAKTRVAVEEKRAERNKHRSVEAIVPAKLNNHLTPAIAQNQQGGEKNRPKGKSKKTVSQRLTTEKSCKGETTHKSVLPPVLAAKKSELNKSQASHHSQKIKIEKKKAETSLLGNKSNVEFSRAAPTRSHQVKMKYGPKGRVLTSPMETEKICTLSPQKTDCPKTRLVQTSPVEEQLKNLYNSQSRPNFSKAASLVSRIGQKRRLHMKNINQQDYSQAQAKIQLLSYLYSKQ